MRLFREVQLRRNPNRLVMACHLIQHMKDGRPERSIIFDVDGLVDRMTLEFKDDAGARRLLAREIRKRRRILRHGNA